MIAKKVTRGRGADSFKRLGRYIMGETEKAAARQAAGASWAPTAAYVLDLSGGGARVGQIRISNCAAAEPADAIAEIEAAQAMNRRAKGDKTYHLVVSFPPGEQPSEAQLRDIEDELCAAIGLADHQRISAVHTDTDHLHIHIAINKVHPATRRCIEPWYDKRKLMAACDRLENQARADPDQPWRAFLGTDRRAGRRYGGAFGAGSADELVADPCAGGHPALP